MNYDDFKVGMKTLCRCLFSTAKEISCIMNNLKNKTELTVFVMTMLFVSCETGFKNCQSKKRKYED